MAGAWEDVCETRKRKNEGRAINGLGSHKEGHWCRFGQDKRHNTSGTRTKETIVSGGVDSGRRNKSNKISSEQL
jgi:hypothetical protein